MAAMATQIASLTETEQVVEGRVVRVGERPIPFERFLDMAEGHWFELVDGVIVEKQPAVSLEHARCLGWLYCVAGIYAGKRGLGLMLSSRIMVQTDDFGGRMPDLLFVRRERLDIVQQKAVRGAPDLVIEIVSPSDRSSDLRALEADYARLGVPELVFIALRRHEIRRLRLGDDGTYEQTIFSSGPVAFSRLDELTLQAEWILNEPRPDEFDTLSALLAA